MRFPFLSATVCTMVMSVRVADSFRSCRSFTPRSCRRSVSSFRRDDIGVVAQNLRLSVTEPVRKQTVVFSSPSNHENENDNDNEISNSNPTETAATSPSHSSSSSSSRRDFFRTTLLASLGGASGTIPRTGNATASSDASGKSVPLAQPPFSTRRKYRHTTFPNSLRLVLVSDRSVTRTTAALTIDNAGQFAEPLEVPGLAHLMEHMILSSSEKYPLRKTREFEEWLEGREGDVNAFTGPGSVCFHFGVPCTSFQEALERFAGLFQRSMVEGVCRSESTLRREIRRVDSELNFNGDSSRAFYLLKHCMNPGHPFSRFSAGSVETLEKKPRDSGIDVKERLLDFFDKQYRPDRAVLVVIGPESLNTLERWVVPFAGALSKNYDKGETVKSLPEPLQHATNTKVITKVLLVKELSDKHPTDKLTLQWPLEMVYNQQPDKPIITAPIVGFILSQLLGRRGPTSLYRFLLQRGWVKINSNEGIPRVTIPIDTSGFQILRLDIALTPQGFANRSTIVSAIQLILKSLSRISIPQESFLLPRQLITQYITTATLHGYVLAPRPSDAVELAMDALTYGTGTPNGVGVPGYWPLVPSPDDDIAVDRLQTVLSDTIKIMTTPSKTISIVTASPKTVYMSGNAFVDYQTGSPISPRVEPVTGAEYYLDDVKNKSEDNRMLDLTGRVEMWLADILYELGPPKLNRLVPSRLRPNRPAPTLISHEGTRRKTHTQSSPVPATITGTDWKLCQTQYTGEGTEEWSLPLPLIPPEPSCRCSFVMQLLSSRPVSARVKESAQAQLWQLSFENAISDLADCGAPGGLAYDLSFNKYGLRICFLGISQTLPSYATLFSRRIVTHHRRLLHISDDIVDKVVAQTKRRNDSQFRKLQFIGAARQSTAEEVAAEGLAFLKSCQGAVCLAQGDLLPGEAVSLVKNLNGIFQEVMGDDYSNTVSAPAVPEVGELLYKPFWKPRGASQLSIPGVLLVSDACGRIKR